jgi:hypothetical protein
MFNHGRMHPLTMMVRVAGLTAVIELLFIGLLHLMPKISKTASSVCTRAPLLDLIVSLLTWVPWLVAGIAARWIGVVGAIFGQAIVLIVWIVLHELAHQDAARGPRIVKVLNRTVGRWQNQTALWVTLIALPGFLLIRFYEVVAYPLLIVLLKFPRYRQAEWVNVSRQKFEGLVGHDLVWCLYCDWMTGVYSLGAEMLRNVESFWCPIRFYDGKKCENCKLDFPDIEGGWVPATGSMADVAQLVEAKYADGERTWFGHPVRFTVAGQPADPQTGATPHVR